MPGSRECVFGTEVRSWIPQIAGRVPSGVNKSRGIRVDVQIAVERWRLIDLAEVAVIRQESARIGIVETCFGIDKARFNIFLVPREGEVVRAGTYSVTLVAPGVVEDRLARAASGLRQAYRRAEDVEVKEARPFDVVVEPNKLIEPVVVLADREIGLVRLCDYAELVIRVLPATVVADLEDPEPLVVVAVSPEDIDVLADLA